MANKNTFPTTLQAAIVYFSDFQNCYNFMVELRWPSGKVTCPYCNSERVKFLETEGRFKCYKKHVKGVSQKFSLKTGTIFEDSPVGIDKWLVAVWMVVNCKNGVSSYEIHRAIGVTQKTAWFMDHRIRFALHQGSFEKMGGEGSTVEVDETYIGGAARFMHKERRKRFFHGGGDGKLAVFGLLERHGEGKKSQVRASVIPRAWKETVNEIIRENVEVGSKIYSDEHGAYSHLNNEGFEHDFVKHAEFYAKGVVHTNGIENFWSLLKRGIRGTYVSVEPFHMFRYLDEQAFRFNQREGNDQTRFLAAMTGIMDKRLTYKLLTGKLEDVRQETN